jgi:N-acetylglucosamine kinase-like BadF-type ATPase
MVQAMQLICPDAGISVATDLMGAAIGLCGNSAGLVLILGTGMNAGFFDGERMHSPMPSLGYLLGDEASGADIGRHLLQDAFHGRIPPHLHEALFGPDGPVLAQVLEQLHRADHPARELASYTARLADHLDAPYVRDLLQGRFHELAELLGLYFTQDQRRTVHATGSVAYGFRELLAGCLLDHGMTVMAVERDPLPGLVRYHQRQG